MKRLGVIANCAKARAGDVLALLAASARRFGLALLADEATACRLPSSRAVPLHEMFAQAQAILAVGGDGTMLRVVRELDGRDLPVLGVNIGGLGFLTSVAEAEIDEALNGLAEGSCLESVRAVAEIVVTGGGPADPVYRALNEVVVGNGPCSRVVTLAVSVNAEPVTSYVCDGLMVSTPTGSTGHSLSAGGPILSPDTPALVLSVICPHTLSSRPLVVPDTSEIEISVMAGDDDLRLTVDGQIGQSLDAGHRVRVTRSPRGVRFVHLPGHSYYGVLRRKLQWSGSSLCRTTSGE